MSNTPPPAARECPAQYIQPSSHFPPARAKLADLPDIDLEDDANSEKGLQQGLKTFDDDFAITNPAALLDDEVLEDTPTTFGDTGTNRPLVDVVIPISELCDEYKNPRFIEQIAWLEEHGFHSIRRIRAFGFAFVERLFRAADIRKAIRRAIEVLDATLPMFNAIAFDAISYEDSYNTFKALIQDIVGGEDRRITTEESLVKTFQDLYGMSSSSFFIYSNAIVYYLRLATAAQIQLASDDYAPFLTNQDIPDSEEILDPQDFSAKFVIPLGKEADDVQISALCRVFQMNVDIAYVDGRDDNRDSAQKVRFVPFRSDVDKDAEPISLLYRRIRGFSKAVELPSHWHNPAMRPGAPILISTASVLHTCPNRKTVQWWNKDTPTIAGVSSPTVSQDEPVQGNLHPIYGFNLQTGSSYLPDFSGNISLDTIRCSTEEGGDINGLIPSSSLSPSASIITLKSGNFSNYCSSNASDSCLSMVITDDDNEESFYFPAAESSEWPDNPDLVGTALVPEGIVAQEEREKTIPFGDGFPPRRTSTITRLVGNAIRDRRSRSIIIQAGLKFPFPSGRIQDPSPLRTTSRPSPPEDDFKTPSPLRTTLKVYRILKNASRSSLPSSQDDPENLTAPLDGFKTPPHSTFSRPSVYFLKTTSRLSGFHFSL
ncbi:hypothetical protein C0995_010212 [Termitomyces sp. Mi166|nr:hypothetical protein C0995_010212 [Termitomyces sp. Mi166\